MKKKFAFAIIIVTLVFSFCSCGEPEPKEYTVGGMKFTIADDLVEETDSDSVIQYAIDAGMVDSASEWENLIFDSKLLRGDEYDVFIKARLMGYNNHELEECIANAFENGDSAFSLTNEDHKTIEADNLICQIGTYEMLVWPKSQTHYLYTLNNGIFYEMDVLLNVEDAYPENYLETISETISFDDSHLGEKQVTLGELSFKIPENYVELEYDESDAIDAIAYGQFGDDYVEMSAVCINKNDWNYTSIGEIADNYISSNNLYDSNRESSEIQISVDGAAEAVPCEYSTGVNDDYGNLISAVFNYNGKTYWFNISGTETADSEYLSSIINFAEVK